MLRVALLAHSVDDAGVKGSGMERACAELIRHAPVWVHFTVISSDIPADLLGRVDWHRVRLPRRISLFRLVTFALIGGLRLARIGVDVVHTNGAIVPNRVDIATVHYCHSGFRLRTGRRAPREASLLRRLNTAVYRIVAELGERWVYRRDHVSCLVPVSSGLASELEHLWPQVAREVIPNGVDASRFYPNEDARARLRAAEGVSDDAVVAVFVGGDWPRKGLDLAITALAGTRNEAVPMRLWVVGEGDERRMMDLAASVGVSDLVRFFGRRLDVERFYAAADVCLLPSAYEAMPLVVLEAAATAVPVVGTRVSGLNDLAAAGGALLAERTSQALSEALDALMRDPATRRAMALAALAWSREYTWKATADATVALYQRLASRGERDDRPSVSDGASA